MKKEYAKRFWVVFSLILLCVMFGTGCGNKTSTKNDIKELEASGTQNTMQVGDTFKVVLKGNMSTGYGWFYTLDNKDMIEFSSTSDVQDKKNVAGSPSTFTWNFKALKAGQTKITFKYYREWEGEASATKDNTKEYPVTITK